MTNSVHISLHNDICISASWSRVQGFWEMHGAGTYVKVSWGVGRGVGRLEVRRHGTELKLG